MRRTKGYFFRTVPNDGQQGDNVANFIHKKLKKTNVRIIDDEEAYSQGLVGSGQGRPAEGRGHRDPGPHQPAEPRLQLGNRGHPGQHAARLHPVAGSRHGAAVLHADAGERQEPGHHGFRRHRRPEHVQGRRQLRVRLPGRHSNVRRLREVQEGRTTASRRSFGLPTYTSVIVNATAIQKACKAGHGKTTRNAVRKQVAKVKLSKKVSLLGFPVAFLEVEPRQVPGSWRPGRRLRIRDLQDHEERHVHARRVTTRPIQRAARLAGRSSFLLPFSVRS